MFIYVHFYVNLCLFMFILHLETKALAKAPMVCIAIWNQRCGWNSPHFATRVLQHILHQGKTKHRKLYPILIDPLQPRSSDVQRAVSFDAVWHLRLCAGTRAAHAVITKKIARRWPATKPMDAGANMWLWKMFELPNPKTFLPRSSALLQEKTRASANSHRAPPTKLSKREPMPLLPRAPMSARGTTSQSVTDRKLSMTWSNLFGESHMGIPESEIHFMLLHFTKSLTVVTLVSVSMQQHVTLRLWVTLWVIRRTLSGREAGTWSSNFPRPCAHHSL